MGANKWQPWAAVDALEQPLLPADDDVKNDHESSSAEPLPGALSTGALRRPDANDLPDADQWALSQRNNALPLDTTPAVALDERDVTVLGDSDDVALRFRNEQRQPTAAVAAAHWGPHEGPLLDVPKGDPLPQWRGPVQNQDVRLWDLGIGREGSRVVVTILLEGEWAQVRGVPPLCVCKE